MTNDLTQATILTINNLPRNRKLWLVTTLMFKDLIFNIVLTCQRANKSNFPSKICIQFLFLDWRYNKMEISHFQPKLNKYIRHHINIYTSEHCFAGLYVSPPKWILIQFKFQWLPFKVISESSNLPYKYPQF